MTTSNKTIIIMDNKTHHSEAEASAHHCPKDPDPKFNPEVQPAGPAGTAQATGSSSLINNIILCILYSTYSNALTSLILLLSHFTSPNVDFVGSNSRGLILHHLPIQHKFSLG